MMVTKDYEIIEYNDSYLAKVLELYRITYDQYMDQDLWEWKYFSDKNKPPLVLLALKEHQVIGIQASILNKLNIAGRDACGFLRTDVLTHADHRRKGIFSALAKEFLRIAFDRGASIVYSFPNEQSFPALVKKLKWHHICSIPLFIKIVDERNFISAISKSKVAEPLSFLLKPLKKIFFNGDRIDVKGYSVIENEGWHEKKLHFLSEKSVSLSPLSVRRDKNHFIWRYGTHPRFKYFNLTACKDQNPQGCLIYKIQNFKGVDACFICDFFINRVSLDAGLLLLNKLESILKEKKISVIGCLMLEDKNECQILKRFGFRKIPRRISGKEFYLVANFNRRLLEKDFVFNASNWFMTWGDIDIV